MAYDGGCTNLTQCTPHGFFHSSLYKAAVAEPYFQLARMDVHVNGVTWNAE